MRRFLIPVLTAFFFLSPGRACARFDADPGGSIFDLAAEAVISVPAPPKARSAAGNPWTVHKEITPLAPKEWTVMVFINAKNNLEGAGLYNVNDMEKIGSAGELNIVVEMGRMKGQKEGDSALDGDWTGARRYLIEKDADTSAVNSPVLMSASEIDLGDYKRTVDFVRWAKVNFPARRYMLIIWNHGSGVMDPKTDQKGISFDDETDNYVRTPQLGLILKEAGRVDVLAFDACLMQMSEIAFEVKDGAEVIVGSEEIVPGSGYPYSLFLGAMADRPGMNAEEAGAATVDAFKAFYDAQRGRKGAQLSAIRTSKLDGLAERLSGFARAARETGAAAALKAARDGVLRYDILGVKPDPRMRRSFYGDLSHFARLVGANLKGDQAGVAELRARSADLREFIDKELVINNKASRLNRVRRELSESGGISIYLPPVDTGIAQGGLEGVFEGKYTDLVFDKATGWYDFVTFLYGVK